MLVPEIQLGQIKILSAYFITSVQQHEPKIHFFLRKTVLFIHNNSLSYLNVILYTY